MHKFLQFDQQLGIERLPLLYSLGDLSAIREMFTPEDGDIGRTQLPILPPIAESIALNGDDLQGYLVESSPSLMVVLREFLKGIATQIEFWQDRKKPGHTEFTQHYVATKRECMNRVGSRLIQVIKQERRLGVYNLFWLVISKHLLTLFESVIVEKGGKQTRRIIAMLPIITQTFQETIYQVKQHLYQEDGKQRRYSKYIDATITSHLGAAFNFEFSRAILANQIHIIFPNLTRSNLLECAQEIFVDGNEKYHISYDEFAILYGGIRSYLDKRLQHKEPGFYEMLAKVLRVPTRVIEALPLETLLFHPTVISLIADDIRELPVRSSMRKKTFFKSWSPQLGDAFGDDSWEFALGDYLNFARDLRRSEIIAFVRNRIQLALHRHESSSSAEQPGISSASGLENKISYQFDRGRIINDLRHVTLVFLDLRGFTELSAGDISDHELKEQLYRFFDPVVNIINHFEGSIKTYAGDGILASFGGKNHALDAVRASLESQKLFTLLKREGKIAFTGLGIGIHSGLVEETYFFPDIEGQSLNTVIGLSANLAGRLSSGKTERKGQVDPHAVAALKNYIQQYDPNLAIGSGALAIFEDRLHQVVDALKHQNDQGANNGRHEQHLAVRVVSGVLNNQGVALSNHTFTDLQTLQPMQEKETPRGMQYHYADPVLQAQIALVKAGDAVFKGIHEKFPVWGIYQTRASKKKPPA